MREKLIDILDDSLVGNNADGIADANHTEALTALMAAERVAAAIGESL